ncbi:cilia- and flagella- associated protein 210-like [Prorops nasuta]|uniref:cilia- and flagella- associated protein 210-like n=1 Tax=Prorops nasuta TaxID=863751 RepID=UPI0034CD5FB4
MTLGQQKLQSTYCLKNEQMQQNTPVSKRPRVLIVPKSAYQRLINYTTENKRRAAEKEKAEKKAADLKKAAYEASKNWDNTIENIRKRREADLLSRKKKNEEAGRRFLEEMTLKNAAEREKTIKEARKLLLYTKPLCRRINSALFTSETLRELDTQVEFRQLLREMDKTMNDKFVKFLRENSEKLENEEKIKNEDKMNANNFYAFQLRQQMEETKKMHDRKENMKKEFDKRELKRILRENKQLEEARIKKEASRKKELAESILSAIKEKRRLEAERRKREEFKDREIEILSKAKIKVNKLLKEIFKEEQQAVELRSQAVIGKQIGNFAAKAVKERKSKTKLIL